MKADFGPKAQPSPLKAARGTGSSKTGVQHWWQQRLSAIALVPLSIWFLFFLGGLTDTTYPGVLAAIAQPGNAVLLIVLSICLFWHGALGVQVIIEDYIHTGWLEVTLQIALRFGAFVCALVCIMAVLAVWLGS